MEIKNSYLMWVGGEHYADSDQYTAEVVAMGVSKRLPGIGMANALSEKGTVVFVAHDNGESDSCDHCMGEVECSECRVRDGNIKRFQAEADKVLHNYPNEDEIPAGKARIVRIRREKIAKMEAAKASCDMCDGEGVYEDGTGGYVMVGGEPMDYRTFNYWMRQPKVFDADKEAPIRDRNMCDHCGGNGYLPRAKIFGVFLPSNIEYILNGKENELVEEQIKDFKKLDMKTVKREAVRGCGKRSPGYYVTAKSGKPSKRAKDLVKELVAAGVIDPAVEVIGDFVRFAKPVDAPGMRRFRGVKKFGLIPEAEEQAEMITEAMPS